MVLAELGQRISGALHKFTSRTIIDSDAIKELVREVQKALLQADVDVHLVKKLGDNILQKADPESIESGANKRRVVQSIVVKELVSMLDPGKEPFEPKKGKSNVIMFVGLQGSGKTTTVAKLAQFYKKKGFSVGVVCADTFRAGAFDQLKQNCVKANVPYYGSYTESDPAVIADEGVKLFKKEKVEVIMVDTSGRHKQSEELFAEMTEVARAVKPEQTIFILDASIGQAAKTQAAAFQGAVPVGAIILTKMDGHAKGGGALSAVAATGSPISHVGLGEALDAIEPFNPKSFVSRLLGMGDVSALMNLLQDEKVFDKEKQEALYKKLTSGHGHFSFRDMYEQFQTLQKMGPLSQVMSMIPGLSNIMQGRGHEEESSRRIKRFMVIIDSMTAEEADSDGTMFRKQPSRIVRVARGSGVSVRAVQEVMELLKPFQKVAAKMKQLGKRGMDPSKLTGPQGMRQLQQMFNPQMLQQMGGVANLQKMMKQFAQGGLPGMM